MSGQPSEWALKNRSVVVYLMIVAVAAGVFSFLRLGRNEDPAFVIKTMVVSAAWPGATIEDTLKQVTERLERQLQETPGPRLPCAASRARASRRSSSTSNSRCRRPKGAGHLVSGAQPHRRHPPHPAGRDDRSVLQRSLRRHVRHHLRLHRRRLHAARAARPRRGDPLALLLVPDVSKIEIIGAQDERIFVEFSVQELANLGIDRQALARGPAEPERRAPGRRDPDRRREAVACASPAPSSPRRTF